MENHYNCIYMYTNKINGKRYVGQAVNFNKRHIKHKSAMTNKNDDEYNLPIQRAFRKYGLNNFKIEILKENLNTQCLLNFYECYYIKKFNLLCKNGKGYNISDGGSNGNPMAGKTEEEIEEYRRKQSEIKKGKFTGENHPMYGKHHSEETKQKISENRKGKQLSEEHKQKLSDAKKGKYNGENHPMYGKHHSEETRQKISEMMSSENNPKAKRVAQYDKQGNLIKIWDYAKQISKENPEINYSGLCSVLQGRTKTHQYKGYIWRYAEEE